MKKLEEQVLSLEATTRPASPGSIDALQAKLGFKLSEEYREYLARFGIIAHDAYETYGLGVPDDYYLNALNAYRDLSADPTYPAHAVPLLELGDGQYYLYDNHSLQIVLWATPNGGVIRTLDQGIEPFLLDKVFQR